MPKKRQSAVRGRITHYFIIKRPSLVIRAVFDDFEGDARNVQDIDEFFLDFVHVNIQHITAGYRNDCLVENLGIILQTPEMADIGDVAETPPSCIKMIYKPFRYHNGFYLKVIIEVTLLFL